jgi:hypothetical protein
VRSAPHLLRDLAFQHRERARQDGRAGDPGLAGQIQERIGARPGEEPGQMFLVLGQDVDRERAGPADDLLRGARGVQARHDHRRIKRQGRDGAHRHSAALALMRRGDHHYAAHEPADNLPESSSIQRLLIDSLASHLQGRSAVIDHLVPLWFSLASFPGQAPARSVQR